MPHPLHTDYRGRGVPGIMYPRGTLVNPEFQYDANAKAGEKGGTLYPIHRKVKQTDIDDLQIGKHIERKIGFIGKLSSIYHEAHLSNNSSA